MKQPKWITRIQAVDQEQEGYWARTANRPLTWVQWRYDWPMIFGRHAFRVRATDGTGALQIEQETGTSPDGATGYHSVTG